MSLEAFETENLLASSCIGLLLPSLQLWTTGLDLMLENGVLQSCNDEVYQEDSLSGGLARFD